MSILRVGIIGLGEIAQSHCSAIAELDSVEVVAVADFFEEKQRQYMDQYNIAKGYNTHTELLEDPKVDAVAITLGHQLHHRLTVDACNAGKHVLVEKPMAISLEQCDQMIQAADDNNVKLLVGLTQHLYGTSLKAKEILDSGQLGPVITAISCISKNWNYKGRRPQYRSRYLGGGMWLTNGVHVVDRLTWVMASQAVSVSAAVGTRAHYQAGDDSATAFIRHKNGLVGIALVMLTVHLILSARSFVPTVVYASAITGRNLSELGRGRNGRMCHTMSPRLRCKTNGLPLSKRFSRGWNRPRMDCGADI